MAGDAIAAGWVVGIARSHTLVTGRAGGRVAAVIEAGGRRSPTCRIGVTADAVILLVVIASRTFIIVTNSAGGFVVKAGIDKAIAIGGVACRVGFIPRSSAGITGIARFEGLFSRILFGLLDAA